MWHERFAGRRYRRRHGHREQDQPADSDERNGPHTAHEQCRLAFVDVVVLAGGGRRLGEIGGVSRPALDLESPLVIGVEEDRKVHCDQADGQQEAARDAGVGEAVTPLMQNVPRSGHADVGEEQHRP